MKMLLSFRTILINSALVCINLSTIAQVGPLLSTKWNQGCNYNAQCPPASGGPCGKSYTGCNATAWAQILKYYNFPTTGMGYHCNSNAPTHCMTFSTQTYNYSVMPNVVSSSNPEVAKLMYHLGIAQDMQWSGTNSTSYFDAVPLMRYFKYTPRMYGTSPVVYSTTSDYINAIKGELDAGRPVLAKGGGHFYIIDGYNTSNQFHINFGWGGSYDGYYSITNVVNGAGNFTPSNLIFNIRPIAGDLETKDDTVFVTWYATGINEVVFSSLQSWTMTTNSSWINLNMSNGTAGHYRWMDGSTFTCSVNHGPVRYGYIYINNGNDIDTVVVKQDKSVLYALPDTMHFYDVGGTQSSILYTSYTSTISPSWSVTVLDSWLSVSPTSGTSPSTISLNISCAPNTYTVPRTGKIVISSLSNPSLVCDTIVITQDPSTSTNMTFINKNEKDIVIFPIPVINEFYIKSILNINSLTIMDFNGKLIDQFNNISQKEYYFANNNLENGIYLLKIVLEDKSIIFRKIVVMRKE
jgi:hypothetical protein